MSKSFWNFCIGMYVFSTCLCIYLSFYTLACVAILGFLFFSILKKVNLSNTGILDQNQHHNTKIECEIKPGEVWVIKDLEDNPFDYNRGKVEVLDFKLNSKGEGWVKYRFLPVGGIFQNEFKKSADFLSCYTRVNT